MSLIRFYGASHTLSKTRPREVEDIKQEIIGILYNRMKMLRRRLFERELKDVGMPMLSYYEEFWTTPMGAVNEAWDKVRKDEKIVDAGSLFRVGTGPPPYGSNDDSTEVDKHKVSARYAEKLREEAAKDKGGKKMATKKITEERKAELLDQMADIINQKGGVFPEVEELSRRMKYSSEILPAFKSYDGAKSAGMAAYARKYLNGVEPDDGAAARASSSSKKSSAETDGSTRTKWDERADDIKADFLEMYKRHGRLLSRSEMDSKKFSGGHYAFVTYTRQVGRTVEERIAFIAKELGIPESEVVLPPKGGPRKKAEAAAEEPKTLATEVANTESPAATEDGQKVAEGSSKVAESPAVKVLDGWKTPKEPAEDGGIPEVLDIPVKAQARGDEDGIEINLQIRLPGMEKPINITIAQ